MSTLTEAQEIEIVDEIIRASVYAIYPDALVTLKLARRCAELEGRDPKQAMRICARALLKRTSMNCMKLRVMLQSTAGLFPDGGVTQIQAK
ncbi:UNVERIFIED_CONTAM: hypothetical protein RF648_20330, partial [Kocuria sp. CPCC 205274]